MTGQLPLTLESFEQASISKLTDYSELIDKLKVSKNGAERRLAIRYPPTGGKMNFTLEGEDPSAINYNTLSGELGSTRYGWSRRRLLEAIHKFSLPGDILEKGLSEPGNYYIPYYMIDLLGEAPPQSVVRRLLHIHEFMKDFTSYVAERTGNGQFSYRYAIDEYYEEFYRYLAEEDPKDPLLEITKDDLYFYADNIWKLKCMSGVQGYPGNRDFNGKLYYEMLYRHLFLTSHQFNWSIICQRQLVPENIIRNIALYDYRLTENLSLKSVCSVLSTRRPTRLPKEVEEEISTIAEPLKMQPGSLLVQRERLGPQERFAMREEPEYLEPAYREVYTRCSNLDQYSKYQLLELARDLGVDRILNVDLHQKSPEEICQILTRVVGQIRQSKYLL